MHGRAMARRTRALPDPVRGAPTAPGAAVLDGAIAFRPAPDAAADALPPKALRREWPPMAAPAVSP